MLVLGRREEEAILIGDKIRILVAEIRPGYVRIGIEAPRELVVVREELVHDSASLDGTG